MGGPIGSSFAQLTPQIQPNLPPPNAGQSQIVCGTCNTTNPAGTRFCGNCGSDLAGKDKNNVNTTTCDKCDQLIPQGSKFCPNCADPVNLCPSCGEDNPDGAISCRRCKKSLPTQCPNCNASVPANSKFCPECGFNIAPSCKKCGTTLMAGKKFCPNCGEPQ